MNFYEMLFMKKFGGGSGSTEYATALSLTINSSTYVMTAQLLNKDGEPLGTAQTIDLPLESTVISGSYDNTAKSLILTLVSGQTITIPIGELISGLISTDQLTVESNYFALANGIRVYVSSTEPTGTIPDGSIWIGG